MQSWKTYLIQTCEFNRPETSPPNILLPSARHLGHTPREMSFRQFLMELWLHTASNDEQTTKTTNKVRKSPISNMAAMLWRIDNHPVLHISLKRAYQNILYRNIYSYLNKHIFKWNIEKGTTLTTSRGFDKCPFPEQRLSDKFPNAGSDKMTNARQMPGGEHTWNWLGHN